MHFFAELKTFLFSANIACIENVHIGMHLYSRLFNWNELALETFGLSFLSLSNEHIRVVSHVLLI